MAQKSGRKKNKKADEKHNNHKANYFQVQASIVGLFSLVVYWMTLNPTVPGGDSGELIATAYHLGVAHPPGYPLYMLLAKLFSYLPFESVAKSINFLSAVCDAAAAALVASTVWRATRDRWVAVLSGLFFAFSPLIWRYAVGAEVFALNNLMVAALCYFLVVYLQKSSTKIILGTAFLFGLGMGNHHTLLFFGLPFALGIFCASHEHRKMRVWLGAVGSGALGLLVYLYMPWSAAQAPAITWGDQTTWDGFLVHLLRKEYGTFRLATTASAQISYFEQLIMFFLRLLRETWAVGLGVVLVGLVIQFKEKKSLILPLILGITFLFYTFVFHALANLPLKESLAHGVQERFWQAPYVLLVVLFGLAAARINKYLISESHKKIWLATLTILTIWQLGFNYSREDQSKNWTFKEVAQALLRPLPENAVLLTSGDVIANSARYFQRVEGLRPDVTILDFNHLGYPWFTRWAQKRYPHIRFPGEYMVTGGPGGYSKFSFFQANQNRPLFVSLKTPGWNKEPELARHYREWARGLLRVIRSKDSAPAFYDLVASNEQAFSWITEDSLKRFDETTWERSMFDVYWNSWVFYTDGLMYLAELSKNPEHYRKVLKELEHLEQNLESLTPALIKNIGTVHVRLVAQDLQHLEKAIEYYARFVEEAKESNPARSHVAQLLTQYREILKAQKSQSKSENQ